jgi:hypothetical protein
MSDVYIPFKQDAHLQSRLTIARAIRQHLCVQPRYDLPLEEGRLTEMFPELGEQ